MRQNMTTIIRRIVDLHKNFIIPYQYTEEEIKKKEIIPCLRTTIENAEDGNYIIVVDVIAWTKDGHEFIDGDFYYNGDGIGSGSTFKESLLDLLEKTETSIQKNKENN